MQKEEKIIALGVLGWAGFSVLLYMFSGRPRTGSSALQPQPQPQLQPQLPVSVVMPARGEPPELVLQSVHSLLRQLDPASGSELLLVSCDTPVFPELSGVRSMCVTGPGRDGTGGKLRARNAGVLAASNEIIVAADADTLYPEGWVAAVTEPFLDPEVVGVAAPSNFFGDPLVDSLLYPVYLASGASKMTGRSSAFRKQAFLELGGFDESAETGIHSTVLEEEVMFMRRLRELGKVVFVNFPVEHKGGFGEGRGLRTHIR